MLGKADRHWEAAMRGRDPARDLSMGTIVVGSVLTPIRKKRNMRPNEATVSITIMPLVGNKLEAKRSSCPRREGPNVMPP
ncbi:hypothetical protein Vadar_001659 [Vaccinium darrowii]|uniref:Uncharacterized protein n=1 Tax=Vaccinium darrowii TaxID=229202 RepID=A0ACB7YIK7_9ERIC|nr:hypothetical protein Vadar_001659 [Vaccinium darrowii]